jgi:predicted ATPase/DNA-binding winged helix-turn-helix (wHTH) protein
MAKHLPRCHGLFFQRFAVSIVYEIGPFRLDPDAGVLTRTGLPMALGARAVAVLTALVKVPNEYVPKSSILDMAWPGVVVEENSLAAQISAIRRVLGGEPGGEGWIETLARRGYRFVGPVTEIRDNRPKGTSGERDDSNLPELLTSFIGRERELVEIKRLLPTTRLLTLVGVGGIGKTRLALQVGAEVVVAYRDGVWLVDLALLNDPALVPSAVAQALGVREVPRKPILETLCAEFRGRQALLLLDNCEHLLEACAHLAGALLHAARELTILATSREPLHLTGEQTYPLPALSLPEPTATWEIIGRSEAVQLFVARAQKQQLDFKLNVVRWPIVAQICVRLDGIPLALELAAARIRSLSVEQIHARLDDRFRLLTGGSRTALPRQRTLRATLDWSYELLAEGERAVLRRLAVFSGGFTLEAASSVASDDTIDEFAVIDLLSQLITRSLVVADTNVADARYRLLETTRAYALDKLVEAGETEAIRRRHAQYFRKRFESAPDDWLRMRDEDWLAIYTPDVDNVRVAFNWMLGPGGDAAIGMGLTGASGPIWLVLSLGTEGRQRLETAIAQVGSQTPELDQARLSLWLGILLGSVDPPECMRALSQSADLYRRLGDASSLGYALANLAIILDNTGRLDETESILAEAFPLLERAGLPRALARLSHAAGNLRSRTGDLASARTHYERALSLYRSIGAQREVHRTLGNCADLDWTLGDLDAALEGFNENVALQRGWTFTNKSTLGLNLANLSGVRTERGELDDALAAAREGLPLLREAGLAWISMDHFALRAGLAGKITNGARLAGYADSAFEAKAYSRKLNELRARERLQALLREKLAPDQFERLLAQGAKLTEDEACRLALED